MASLARNTYYNISAFAVNTILSLATVPLLVRGYGLDGYGTIILARLLLPTGLLGILECGFPEVTARSVAASHATGSYDEGKRRITAAFLMALLIGLTAGLVLYVAGGLIIPILFHSAAETAGDLQFLLLVTAASLPLQLTSSVLRGAFEGAERFSLVRSVEVLSNAAYLVIVALLVSGASTSIDAAIAYVAVWNARGALYIILALIGSIRGIGFQVRGVWEGNAPFLVHAMRLTTGKFFSLLLNFGPTIVLGALSTVATVGSYDVVMRIPKVLKTVSGMFNGALLPFAAKADATGDHQSLRSVVEDGTIAVVGLVTVMAVSIGLYADEVLRLWLGINDPHLALYLRIALVWPVLVATSGIGVTMLMSRSAAAGVINLYSMATTLTYFALAFLLFPSFDWRAFVVALVLSQALSAPLYWRLLVREYGVDSERWSIFGLRLTVVLFLAFAISYWIRTELEVPNLGSLALHGGVTALALSAAVMAISPTGVKKLARRFLIRHS